VTVSATASFLYVLICVGGWLFKTRRMEKSCNWVFDMTLNFQGRCHDVNHPQTNEKKTSQLAGFSSQFVPEQKSSDI